jgi:hypothetical protein
MDVNVKKCISVSMTWQSWHKEDQFEPFVVRCGQCQMNEQGLYVPGSVEANCHYDTIPIQNASIYLGVPIGFNGEECSFHCRGVLESMKDRIRQLGKCNLNITQKLEGVKFRELPRIDYRMMCADLLDSDLDKFDSCLMGEISSWSRLKCVPVGVPGISWMDGGFTIPSLRERQNTIVLRTVCDMMTSAGPVVRELMELFEAKQAAAMGKRLIPRGNTDDIKSFLRLEGLTRDMRKYSVARLHSIFPRAVKASQESDISVFVKDGKAHLHHDGTESFTDSKYSRPSMWIPQAVRRKVRAQSFRNKVQTSKWW